jgi:hypothetical protein
MALPRVPPIYFDADEIIATHGACLNHLNEHIEEVRHTLPRIHHRSLRSIARVLVFAGVACLSGYLLTALDALPVAG